MDPFFQDIIVKPSKPLNVQLIPLPAADQWQLCRYLPWILCFRLDAGLNPADTLSDLQIGLRHTLDEMPFLAAKFRDVDETSGRVQLELQPGDGVGLCVRQRQDTNYGELSKMNFPPHVLNQSFVPIKVGARTSDVVIQIQATFVSGGLVLGLSINHSAMDAKATTIALSVWAKHIRAIASARMGHIAEPSVRFPAEALDRSPLFGNDGSGRAEDFAKFRMGTEDVRDVVGAATLNPVSTYWYFSNANLNCLKEAAQNPSRSSGDQQWISTNDALCALLWTRVFLAQQRSGRQFEWSALTIPFDVRKLMGFHPNMVANAVTDVYTTSSAQQLIGIDALSQTAARIRKELQSVKPEDLRREWGLLDSVPKISALERSSSNSHLVVSTFAKLPWYTKPWGPSMGNRVDRFRFPPLSFSGAVILPSHDDGLEVLLVQEEDVIDQLQNDPGFTKYGQLLVR